MQLCDRADGVSGHFCIGRYNEAGKFWEFYNNGKWCSAGHVYVGEECAAEAMEKISNSTQQANYAMSKPTA